MKKLLNSGVKPIAFISFLLFSIGCLSQLVDGTLDKKEVDKLAPVKFVIDKGNVSATITETPAGDIDLVRRENHTDVNDFQIIKGWAKMDIAPFANIEMTKAGESKSDVIILL